MYPPDIDQESRCRLPLPKREDLDANAQLLFDSAVHKDSGLIAGLHGPLGIKLHSPEFARLSVPALHYLRRRSGLTERVREVAVLTTARCLNCQFEWTVHESEAREVGVPEATIQAIKYEWSVERLDPLDALVVVFGREIFRARSVTAETYAKCLAHFGRRQLVDLVALMGNYAATAALLIAFDMQLGPGMRPLLPDLESGEKSPRV